MPDELFLPDARDQRRIEAAVLDYEQRAKGAPEPNRMPSPGGRWPVRMRLLEDIEFGQFGRGELLAWNNTREKWVGTGRHETKLFPARHWPTHWHKDQEVNCHFVPGLGWGITADEDLLGTGFDLVPYGVYAVGGSSRAGTITLLNSESPFSDDFVFLAAQIPTGGMPDAQLGFAAASVRYPGWAAYLPGATDGLPAEVLTALGIDDSAAPAIGEYWGPDNATHKLRRTATTLELFWWKWTPPEYSDDEPVIWIAPDGWWEWGWPGWGWGSWGTVAPGWWAGNNSTSWWGAWGVNWWNTRWGGRPPLSSEIPAPTGALPTPGEGTITQEERYGWIVWEYGWRVLGVDQANEIAFVWGPGPLAFSSRLVVENPDPPV